LPPRDPREAFGLGSLWDRTDAGRCGKTVSEAVAPLAEFALANLAAREDESKFFTVRCAESPENG